uniref:NADH-ubiquinone oxidoreductase chain 2 n=1 Tax=Phyllodiaptomus tunguidus TaxID=2690417 RepID=A0A6G6YB89_9MAXI|nr:NADH dehydrogenase subunit 2 [Phyllodiaptomus tunguidus]QIG86762.1 NADH dehydrogenase subunit 2 [Phyllodiaptomus tunguidus]UDF84402.1 NADH dehydrogenase subunit 2 [Phyllodiaptomus tunguidus]UDF84415.1 NADH dehydrogenase subunit 2 [Phyllodiaptomus tunguidus]
MMFLSPLLGYFSMVLFSVTLALSAHSMFFFWISLEVNILAILPVLTSAQSPASNEIALKYFISQGIASIFFLCFSLLSLKISSLTLMAMVMILFKMGLPPLHSWMVSIFLASPLWVIFLISTVQKLIPLHILAVMQIPSSLLTGFVLLTLVLSLMTAKNMQSIRPMLILSTFGNSCWMAASTLLSKLWLWFLFFYSLFLASALKSLLSFNIQKLSSLLSESQFVKILCFLNFLNLAGLPPFSGFLLKLTLLKTFLLYAPLTLMLLLISLSLIVLYVYLSITFFGLASFSASTNQSTHPSSIFMGILTLISSLFAPLLMFLSP